MSLSNNGVTNVQKGLEHQINKLQIRQLDNGDKPSPNGSAGGLGGNSSGANLRIFEVQINPEKYQRQTKIHYADQATQGKPSGERDFTRVEGETLSLNFILDGTGVVPQSLANPMNANVFVGDGAPDSVAKDTANGGITDVTYVTRRVQELSKVVYNYVPEAHEPPTVFIVWGDVIPFKGKLDNMQVNYTLFHPNGAPLRAEVQLSFVEHRPTVKKGTGTEGEAAGANVGVGVSSTPINSPDLSHSRTVTASDTLPLMSADVYGDTQYHWQVARANGLTQFRQLEPNTELLFPPLER